MPDARKNTTGRFALRDCIPALREAFKTDEVSIEMVRKAVKRGCESEVILDSSRDVRERLEALSEWIGDDQRNWLAEGSKIEDISDALVLLFEGDLREFLVLAIQREMKASIGYLQQTDKFNVRGKSFGELYETLDALSSKEARQIKGLVNIKLQAYLEAWEKYSRNQDNRERRFNITALQMRTVCGVNADSFNRWYLPKSNMIASLNSQYGGPWRPTNEEVKIILKEIK